MVSTFIFWIRLRTVYSGVCSLAASQLWAIAQALEVPVSYFYQSLRPSEVWRNPDAEMA